jgi:hypothetical protein
VEIDVIPEAIPASDPQYQIHRKHQEIFLNIIDEWEKAGIVRKLDSGESSPWNAVHHLVEQNGKHKLISNYIKLNKYLRSPPFPMDSLPQTMHSLTKGRAYSMLDVTGGFHHLKVSKRSQKYLAFTVPGRGHTLTMCYPLVCPAHQLTLPQPCSESSSRF